MCLEAIKNINDAEETARQAKLLAQRNAQEAIEDAISAGKEAIASTLTRAEAEIAHMRRLTDQKAQEQALELASTTANRRAAMLARAERLLDGASQMIVERIMNTQ